MVAFDQISALCEFGGTHANREGISEKMIGAEHGPGNRPITSAFGDRHKHAQIG